MMIKVEWSLCKYTRCDLLHFIIVLHYSGIQLQLQGTIRLNCALDFMKRVVAVESFCLLIKRGAVKHVMNEHLSVLRL